MKPKKGDLTYESNGQYKALVIWGVDVEYQDFTNVNIATPADLAAMGLVRQAEYDALKARLKNIIDCFHGFDPEPTPAEPQPVFEVGDKVRVIVGTLAGNEGRVLRVHSNGWIEAIRERETSQFMCGPADLELISKAEKPQPHVWEVGQYALCPDGKVRRLTHAPFYCFHDLYECDIRDCTPVPEPPMPELPKGFKIESQDRLTHDTTRLKLESWIAAMQLDDVWWNKECLRKLLALAEWRKLVGREV